jgi:hypothetical protein
MGTVGCPERSEAQHGHGPAFSASLVYKNQDRVEKA